MEAPRLLALGLRHLDAGLQLRTPLTNLPDVYAAAMRRATLLALLLLAGCSGNAET